MFDDDSAEFRRWCAEACGYDLDEIISDNNQYLYYQLLNRFLFEKEYWENKGE